MIRLDKLLANEGYGTRKEVKKLIRDGFVEINGEVCKKDDRKVDEENDQITIDGELVTFHKNVYIMMNKPEQTLCSNESTKYPSVLEYISEYAHRDLFTVGRLDVDTVGLLLITDDGDFAHHIISPSHHLEKIYEVHLQEAITDEMIEGLENGLEFKEFTSMPAKVEAISSHLIHLTIMEGKFHQVKRMLHAVGNEVVALKRLQIGNLVLDPSLQEGDYRELTQEEIADLLEG